MRWLVERANGEFEDVGAECVQVVDGCLVFHDDPFDGGMYFVAAGQWLTVCEAAE
jgi:hypothetical protein